MTDRETEGQSPGGPGFRARLLGGLMVAAILPVVGFGVVVLVVASGGELGDTLGRVLLFAAALAVVFAILVAYVLSESLGAPLRTIAEAVERTSAGDLSTRIHLPGDDEVARLAESHNRLAGDLARRNRELRRILEAIEETTIRDRPEAIAARAATRAREAFGMIDAVVRLTPRPSDGQPPEHVPGEPRAVQSTLTASGEPIGLLAGTVPATRSWDPADQDLLDLFASEVGAAVRNAQLFARVEDQNNRLTELDAAKDDFLRGVSHNLQTPLASIRAYADQLAGEHPDRRLGIITEQSDRLSRMVRQLLTVSRIASGALRARPEVLAVAPRVRRTWEALAMSDVPFTLRDEASDWLAVGDPDQLDQVLWALLDNAVVHGRRSPVEVTVGADEAASLLLVTVRDSGPGIGLDDRERLFQRYERGTAGPSEGSGLGLYVSRELCRAMGGDLVLGDRAGLRGAAFTIQLPAERADESLA